MMSELFATVLRANLVAAAAILAVLILRRPTRRLFGPELAYGLWAAPPLAIFATLLPARSIEGAAGHALAEAVADISLPGLTLWALGVAATAAGLAWAQLRFLAQARAGRAGPSVVGVISPRIVMPRDDGSYSDEERALIRAHEREHVARQDPRARAVAAVLQAAGWFNPLIHLGAHVMRLDQELACDAAVIQALPERRRDYGATLLKAHMSSPSSPLACTWLAGTHPLEVRLTTLALRPVTLQRYLRGAAAVGATALVVAAVVWAGG